MVTAVYYREQARLLEQWANTTGDAATAKQLRARARDYLTLADELEKMPAPPPGGGMGQAPVVVVQQQQQRQRQRPATPEGSAKPAKQDDKG